MATSADSIYEQVREMAANFEIRPDERVNESALSKKLGASRTPLREGLNRLVAEGLLIRKEDKGFYCRSLSPEAIVDLYELREAIECAAVALAVSRASDAEISSLQALQAEIMPHYTSDAPAREIVRLDEEFHLGLVRLAHNPEMTRAIQTLYERIRFVRWISMRNKLDITHLAHSEILDAVCARDAAQATKLLSAHVRTSTEEATDTVREAYSQIYMPNWPSEYQR